MTPPEFVNLDRRYGHAEWKGGGGYGNVYLVHHEALDKDMALKVMKDEYAKAEQFVELFKREARILAKLSHPNIVTVHDAGEGTFKGREVFYIAMEYVSGGTLRDHIQRKGGPLSPDVTIKHTMRVAEALGVAHQSGLIHRDIKPENILLTESDVPKVADFGIARAATGASSSGLRLATPRYISPEQAEGEPATFQSDLYSLGIVLYEMLTGKVPYDAESAWGILSQHIRGQLLPPKEVNPNVPQGINQVCVRLLARDPNQRYPDAATLIEDLKALKDNPDAIADDMGPTEPLEEVREDTAPTTRLTRSLANRLTKLYLQARQLHRDQDWQAVVDIFDQIHRLDSEYPDPDGLLVSAREALTVLETITASNAGRIQLLRTMGSEEHKNWWGKLLLGLLKERRTASVESVAFSPDGRMLASRARDNTMRLWRVKDGALLHTLEGCSYSVNGVAFSPDGRMLASGSDDKTVRLWGIA